MSEFWGRPGWISLCMGVFNAASLATCAWSIATSLRSMADAGPYGDMTSGRHAIGYACASIAAMPVSMAGAYVSDRLRASRLSSSPEARRTARVAAEFD